MFNVFMNCSLFSTIGKMVSEGKSDLKKREAILALKKRVFEFKQFNKLGRYVESRGFELRNSTKL